MVLNVLVLYQLTFFVLSLVLAFCTFLPLGLNLYAFRGNCLLFTNGTWRESDGHFLATWASQAFCDYNILWSSFNAVVSLYNIQRYVSHLCRKSDASFLGAFIDVIVSILMCLISLSGSIIITMGYQVWCDSIMQRFEQCEDASINDILKDSNIDLTNFYVQFGTAQFGSWCLWACWVGLSVVSLLKVCKFHHTENIRISMIRERNRLIPD